jgi:predicted ArsR family transcriptional regulator
MNALSKFPVLGVGSLAREVGVSKDTAKRWLIALVEKGRLEVREFNGMNQYAYARLIDILDMHVRFTSKP